MPVAVAVLEIDEDMVEVTNAAAVAAAAVVVAVSTATAVLLISTAASPVVVVAVAALSRGDSGGLFLLVATDLRASSVLAAGLSK